MGRPSNTEERRQQIVAGLLRVMAERGYERASVAEIAKAANLSPGLVHYHFEDKQEILLTLVEQLSARVRERVSSRLARVKGDDARARVDAFLDAFLATGADADPASVTSWVTISAEAIRQPEVRAIYEKVVRADLEQLEELVGAVTGKRRARTVAAGLFAALQGYFVLAASAPGLVPPGSAANTVKRMAEGLIDTLVSPEDAPRHSSSPSPPHANLKVIGTCETVTSLHPSEPEQPNDHAHEESPLRAPLAPSLVQKMPRHIRRSSWLQEDDRVATRA